MSLTARSTLLPGAEPFFFPAGKASCLLVHGFTGTPKEMRWLGEHLHHEGFTVLGIRLAGHATRLEDLYRIRWRDWLASVEDGWHLLHSAGHAPVVVMGLSLGGVLSLLFASAFPVAGVVAMSTPYRLPPHPLLPFLRPLSRVMRTMAKGPDDTRDKEAQKEHIAYASLPVHGLAELRDLLAHFRHQLAQVRAPVLMIHSRGDQTVPPKNALQIFEALGSEDKALLWVANSGHPITVEPDRETVFRAAAQFARRVTQATGEQGGSR